MPGSPAFWKGRPEGSVKRRMLGCKELTPAFQSRLLVEEVGLRPLLKCKGDLEVLMLRHSLDIPPTWAPSDSSGFPSALDAASTFTTAPDTGTSSQALKAQNASRTRAERRTTQPLVCLGPPLPPSGAGLSAASAGNLEPNGKPSSEAEARLLLFLPPRLPHPNLGFQAQFV